MRLMSSDPARIDEARLDHLYYDLYGQPISQAAWSELYRQVLDFRSRRPGGWTTPEEDPTRIGLDRVEEAIVSTVWLGLDQGIAAVRGAPLIFETRVFGGDFDGLCNRYSSKEAALAGHRLVVAELLECPAGGMHDYRDMPSELDTGGSPAGRYCSECGKPAPLPVVEYDG